MATLRSQCLATWVMGRSETGLTGGVVAAAAAHYHGTRQQGAIWVTTSQSKQSPNLTVTGRQLPLAREGDIEHSLPTARPQLTVPRCAGRGPRHRSTDGCTLDRFCPAAGVGWLLTKPTQKSRRHDLRRVHRDPFRRFHPSRHARKPRPQVWMRSPCGGMPAMGDTASALSWRQISMPCHSEED